MKTLVSGAKTLVTSVVSTTTGAPSTTVTTIIPKIEPDLNTSSGSLQFQTPMNPVNNNSSTNNNNNITTNPSKRPASLDLKLTTKKPRLVAPSPLQMDHPVNTPEVETIILSNNLIQTPKPGVVFPKNLGPVTTEQEEFGKGFEEALKSIHNQNSAVSTIATTGGAMSGGSFTYTKLDSSFPIAIKDEPQQQPPSPGCVQPIDMENQEMIKLERKRQRNRVAASKCRKRKLERISKLEEKVKSLKGENSDLASLIKSLKDQVAQLKQEVVEHINFGCAFPTYNLIAAK